MTRVVAPVVRRRPALVVGVGFGIIDGIFREHVKNPRGVVLVGGDGVGRIGVKDLVDEGPIGRKAHGAVAGDGITDPERAIGLPMKENRTDETKKDGRTATLKAKKEKRDGKREQTIKCNLSGRLLGKPEEKEKMLMSILDLVSSVSKMAHKASIVFNRMLLHCLDNDTDLPDLTDKILYNQ